MNKPFSKKLLIIDYAISVLLIVGYFICVIANGVYTNLFINELMNSGIDISNIVVPRLLDLEGFGVLLATWITQLGISSGAYYILIRSEHKIQMPMKLISELPDDIKESVDMTTVITTVLSSVDN